MARAREEAANAPKKPQRDEWMTLGPPTGLSHIDALKRPTQFQKHSRETAAVDQTWMETPAERAAREREEGAGKRKARGEEERDAKRRRERDDEMRRRIEEHSVGLAKVESVGADGRNRAAGRALWSSMPRGRTRARRRRLFGTTTR
jgi:hypothetical protein